MSTKRIGAGTTPHRVMKPVHPCGVKPREHAGIPIGDEVPRHRDDDEEGEHHGVTGYDLGDGLTDCALIPFCRMLTGGVMILSASVFEDVLPR